MYSPKISESLIPILYILAQKRHIPMTRLVNELILAGLITYEQHTPLFQEAIPSQHNLSSSNSMEYLTHVPFASLQSA